MYRDMAATKIAFDLGFRVYSVAIAIVAVFTALFAMGYITVSPTLFGGAWLALAALGGVIILGLTVNKDETIKADRTEERRRTWESSLFTGWLLNIYLIAAAIWAGVSFGWFIGGQSAASIPVVGYGWLAVAGYGALVLVGTVASHSEHVATAVDPTEELET